MVDAGDVAPRPGSAGPLLHVRPTLGPQTGFSALEQAVLETSPGRTGPISVGAAAETLFVLGGRGTVHAAGEASQLEPEVGLSFVPGSVFELENPGPEPLRLIAVRVPDPAPAPADPAPAPADPAPAPADPALADPARAESTPGEPKRAAVSRLADQALEAATADREFRIVADPDAGLCSATHFVGYIPTARAPDHFHTYDEVIYVLDGEGVMHAGELTQPLGPGSCIQLPARTVHCLENTGTGPMRVVGVFRPAGSPAAAFYPDGTPAYEGRE